MRRIGILLLLPACTGEPEDTDTGDTEDTDTGIDTDTGFPPFDDDTDTDQSDDALRVELSVHCSMKVGFSAT